MIEVLVAIGLLASAVVLLGSGANLWQTGLRWPVQRFDQLHLLRQDLALWPAEPWEICGSSDSEDWLSQITVAHTQQWGSPEIWVPAQGWMPISGQTCSVIPAATASVIKVVNAHLETVILVERP
jgi:hypothetical protein